MQGTMKIYTDLTKALRECCKSYPGNYQQQGDIREGTTWRNLCVGRSICGLKFTLETGEI